MMLGQLDVYIGKKKFTFTPLHNVPKNRKMNFRYFAELNVKVNVLEEDIGELLYDFDKKHIIHNKNICKKCY